jgi:hypothetical protein
LTLISFMDDISYVKFLFPLKNRCGPLSLDAIKPQWSHKLTRNQ